MAEHMARVFHEMGLQVQWQEVEEGRPNVLGTWRGTGGGKTLMFNGHMDTSYSGREPWLGGKGFQPEARVEGGLHLRARDLEHEGRACLLRRGGARAPGDAGVRLRGDVLIAAVVGEIEKTQWGDEFRARSTAATRPARATSSRTAASPTCACSASRPRASVVLGHYGSIWLRISTRGPFMHTAFSGGRAGGELDRADARGPRRGARVDPGLADADVATGASRASSTSARCAAASRWRVSRTPSRTDLFLDVRVPPTMPMAEARSALGDWVRSLQETLPGLRDRLGDLRDSARARRSRRATSSSAQSTSRTRRCYGAAPERDTVRWFSDASRADSLRHPDRELRDVERPPRAPRARTSRFAGWSTRPRLRAHRAASLLVSVYELPLDLPVPVDDGACAHLEGMAVPPVELESSVGPVEPGAASVDAVVYVYPAHGQARHRAEGDLERDPRRARLHAAVVRVPRPRRGTRAASGASSPGCPPRRWRTRSSSRSGSGSCIR